jgi:hypothetical protein
MKFVAARLALAFLLSANISANAQEKSADKTNTGAANSGAKAPATSPGGSKTSSHQRIMSPLELARAAYMAQGGEKFRNLKNMMMLGSVDLYSPNSTQSLSGKFGMIVAGEKVRQDVQSAIVSFN